MNHPFMLNFFTLTLLTRMEVVTEVGLKKFTKACCEQLKNYSERKLEFMYTVCIQTTLIVFDVCQLQIKSDLQEKDVQYSASKESIEQIQQQLVPLEVRLVLVL